MDNYLSHRWPQGPGLEPPPMPQETKERSSRRWLVYVTAVLLCVALVASVCVWAVNGLAQALAQMGPGLPEDPRPRTSRTVSNPDWSPEDLPWGEPDPDVQLSVRSPGPVLSGSQAYEGILPSLVAVEAAHGGGYGAVSGGTGVVVADTGYIVTNYHIIDDTVAIRVQLLEDSSRYFEARVIGFDEEFDLAVLKFDPEGTALTPAPLGDSDRLAVGDWVYAVGNPMGYLQGSISGGLVSALGRDEGASGSALGLIQTDAAINPGSSGGALLNESGQVVGITCAKITGIERENGESVENGVVLEGLSLAIPISDAIPFLNRILATGKTWRPAIGIQCQAAQVGGRKGIRVGEVTGSAPREAGLRKNDLILTANGTPVTSLVELRRVLYRTGADQILSCTVLRGDQELDISFRLTDSLSQE